MVEGARLEIVWAAMSRRFESSRFRQDFTEIKQLLLIKITPHLGVLFLVLHHFIHQFLEKLDIYGTFV